MWLDVDTAITVPVNLVSLIDDTDFKTRETGIVYNESGMALVWNFQTTAGVTSQTAVTPTTGGDYDWTHSGGGIYKIEIPASGGASINNDTSGSGWFTGICDGVLAWTGPRIGFRAASLNNSLIDGGDVLAVNLTEMGGVEQSAIDLKDFADAGYDPATNKVQGVVLVDTTTTNTDMVGTDSAALASVCTETRLAELDAANIPAELTTIIGYVDELESRLTALRAGYLDNLSAGAVSLEATSQTILTNVGTLPASGDIADAVWDETLSEHTTDVDSTGYALASVSTLSGNNLVTINVEDIDTSEPIPDVFVRITDSVVSQTFHRGYTDYLGQISVTLDDGDYGVLLRKAFYDFTVPETLTVAGSGTATYAGSGFAASTPSSSGDTCVVYGWVTDLGNTPIRNAKIEAIESDTRRFNDTKKIVKTTKSIRSSISGYWELELIRSNQLVPAGIPYAIKITYPGFEYNITIVVPDSNSIDFSTLV